MSNVRWKDYLGYWMKEDCIRWGLFEKLSIWHQMISTKMMFLRMQLKSHATRADPAFLQRKGVGWVGGGVTIACGWVMPSPTLNINASTSAIFNYWLQNVPYKALRRLQPLGPLTPWLVHHLPFFFQKKKVKPREDLGWVFFSVIKRMWYVSLKADPGFLWRRWVKLTMACGLVMYVLREYKGGEVRVSIYPFQNFCLLRVV